MGIFLAVVDLGDRLPIVATDRRSAFDVVLPTAIPGKGRILTEVSNSWFGRGSAIVPNHLTGTLVREVVRDVGVLEETELPAHRVGQTGARYLEALDRLTAPRPEAGGRKS